MPGSVHNELLTFLSATHGMSDKELQEVSGADLEMFIEAMLEDRVELVFYETLRKYQKRLPDVHIDDPNAPEPPAPAVLIDRTLEDEE